MKIRALIVEDEPLARDLVRAMLADEKDIEIVGECETGVDAVREILELVPDLVFLDVQIPDLDGFGVLDEVRNAVGRLPTVIFVTAYDCYALRAFEVHAVDYLLKPYDAQRFGEALQRARQHLERRELDGLNQKLQALLGEMRDAHKTFLERFVVQTSGRVFFVPVEEVEWIEAQANYLQLHTGKTTYLVRGTMQTVEGKLDPRRFVRIHRSAIVNIRKIRELQPWFHGEYKVLLHDGTSLTLSRSFRDRLPVLMGEPLHERGGAGPESLAE
jgi:two-component system, LytTR family, response regulator